MVGCTLPTSHPPLPLQERFGRFHRRCDAGLHFLVPFLDRTRPVVWRSTEVFNTKDRSWATDVTQRVRIRQTRSDVIDLRESILDFPSQTVITRDNVSRRRRREGC
jgi:regulator of protease activity HflC (stomatin/prohibitin superfamily)